jgi:autotransporter-associated beta strand protein
LVLEMFVQFSDRSLANLLLSKHWLCGMGLLLIGASSLYGQDSWQGSSGSWFTSSAWSLGMPPNFDLDAVIDNGATVQIGPGPDGQEAAANSLTIGGGSTVALLSGGTLDLNNPLLINSSGTLLLNGGTLGGAGTIQDNGIVEFLGSFVYTESVDAHIVGTGSLVLNLTGGELLVDSTGNTYSGQTQILNGSLVAETTNAFSPNSAFTVNSTLDLNGFNNAIGSLSGTGTVINSGSSNATLTVGGNNVSSVFSGVLEDGSAATLALTKVGTGTLILTGTNTYTGPTTVNAGTLEVDGSIASVETLINSGGVLTGSGSILGNVVNNGMLTGSESIGGNVVNNGVLTGSESIRGNVVNNGIVSPGSPIGTLTISGNYIQNAGGTLRIGVGGTAPGQFSLLAVGGHATLGGNLQIVSVNGFQLAVGNKLTFLTATGGVSGNFSTIQNPFPSGTAVEAQFVLLPNAVEIEGTQGSFATIIQSLGPGVTPNELAVAKAIDSARGDPREAALFAFLNSQPIANLPHDFSLIAPTQISSINASVSMGKVQTSNIGQRMLNIHAGSTGFSSSGFTLNGEAPTFGNGLAGETGAEGKSGPSVLAPIPENRWGFFVTGLGEFTNVDSTANANGYDVNTGGITLGVDYRVTPYFAVGLLGGYAHNNVSLVGGGNIDVNGGTFGAYATLFGNGFYLDAAVTGGPDGYDTHRTALVGSASGSTEGADLNVVVSAGYDWKYGNFSIGPTASFEFGYVGLDGFSETGSLAPLKFPDQNTQSETTTFGAKATYEWKVGKITLIPQVSAGWQHEYGSVAYQVVAGFASGAGTSFTVNGPEIGRDSLLIGAGVSMIWSDRISTYVFYDGDVARTNYDSHTVTGGFRITF